MEYREFPTVFFALLHLSVVQKFTYRTQILSAVLIYNRRYTNMGRHNRS